MGDVPGVFGPEGREECGVRTRRRHRIVAFGWISVRVEFQPALSMVGLGRTSNPRRVLATPSSALRTEEAIGNQGPARILHTMDLVTSSRLGSPSSRPSWASPWRSLFPGLLRVVASVFALAVVEHTRADSAAELKFFEDKIRPLLAEQCYECHSAKSEKLKGQFLADSRAGIRRGGESKMPGVVPGDPEASRLITAVRWKDPDIQMPPKRRLSEAQVRDLESWVKMGAPDPREETSGKALRKTLSAGEARNYWAFQPLRNPPLPVVGGGTPGSVAASGSVSRTPIDQFVLAQLQARNLGFAAPANWRTLLRRASFAITGLPPEPADVARMEREGSREAFMKAVDQMLASPRYGERWGRHWLDVARFAESSGFEHDYDRPTAWHYRDFVIRALNRDMPYDQFVRWQLAGDELAPEDPDAQMATGFLGAGVFPTQITANEVERVRYDALDDMATTTGVGFLGLSVGCARCHDHKFDPISSRDYYRLISTFTTTVRSEVDLDLDPESNAKRVQEWEAKHRALVLERDRYEKNSLEAEFKKWIADPSSEPAFPAWLVLEFSEATSVGGATFVPQSDGSLLATGKSPEFDTYRFVARLPKGQTLALRLEALAHISFVKGGPGRADNGNFALSDLRAEVRPVGSKEAGRTIALQHPRATFEQKGLPIAATIDAEPKSGWAVDPQFGKDHAASYVFAEPIVSDGSQELVLTLKFDINNRHSIGRPRVSIHVLSPDVPAPASVASPELDAPSLTGIGVLEAIRAWRLPAAARDVSNWAALRAWHRSIDPVWRRHSEAIAASLAAKPKPETTKVLVATEGLPAVRMHTQGADFFEKTYFLRRGDVNQKGDAAEAGFLPVLMGQGETRWRETPPAGWRTSYRRRSLANWITDTHDGAGALLARVMVNRVWAAHFGRGIVATPNDFGIQGEAPSHPDLLEWLASEFVRSGWSLKALHRLILDSAVWQQATARDEAVDAEVIARARSVDPGNVLLWHFPRKRLEAEAIRDHLLCVSGVLDQRMGGAGTLDENHLRRSVYFMVKRSQMSRTLQLFDAPDAVLSAANRPATITAPQALLFLNSPFVRARSADFARRLEGDLRESPARAVRHGYELAAGRAPTDRELSDGVAFLEQQGAFYNADAKDQGMRRALVDFCQVLFGLNEFVYVD